MESKHLWITRILHVLLSFKLFLMKACQYGQCCLPLKQTSKASFDCTYMSAQYFLRCSSMFMSYTKLVSLMTCPFLCGTYKSAILPKLRQTSTCGGWKSRGANESLVPSFCCCLGRWQRIERNRLKEQTHERGQGFEVDYGYMFLPSLSSPTYFCLHFFCSLINYLIGKPQCTCLRTLIYLTMAPGVIFHPLKGRQVFSISASLTFIWAPLPFIIIIQGGRRGIFLVKGIPRNKEKGLKSARLSKCRWIPKYFERQKQRFLLHIFLQALWVQRNVQALSNYSISIPSGFRKIINAGAACNNTSSEYHPASRSL